jgi:hypothetical protein
LDRPAVVLLETVNRADVGMIERSKYRRFALEARHAIPIVCERLGKHLQRDVAAELSVAR